MVRLSSALPLPSDEANGAVEREILELLLFAQGVVPRARLRPAEHVRDAPGAESRRIFERPVDAMGIERLSSSYGSEEFRNKIRVAFVHEVGRDSGKHCQAPTPPDLALQTERAMLAALVDSDPL